MAPSSFREVFQNAQSVVIEFIRVPEFTSASPGSVGNGANTVRLTLEADGTILTEYSDCTVQDALVGISPGGGISAASEMDITSSGFKKSSPGGAFYEQLTGPADPFDLVHPDSLHFNRLRLTPTNALHITYRLHVDLSR